MDELEDLSGFEGDLMAYFGVSQRELERLVERAERAEDVRYIMAGEDWCHDQAVAMVSVQHAGGRSVHA